jgi:hypothetical protein
MIGMQQRNAAVAGQRGAVTTRATAVLPRRPAVAVAARANANANANANADAAAPTTLAQRAASAAAAALLVAASSLAPAPAYARPEGVNQPELLPKEAGVTVIDVAGFLAPSEEKRLAQTIARLEADTGYKVRVLAQNYPNTPGEAIRDYWAVDDSTVVFVADPTFGDLLNFNVGAAVDLDVPRNFWNRLSGKFGNRFFVRDNGEAAAIVDTVQAIDACLREPSGRAKCSGIVEVSDTGI